MQKIDLIINRIQFLHPREKHLLSSHIHDEHEIHHINKEFLQKLLGRRIFADISPQQWIRSGEQDMRWMESMHITVLKINEYPSLLREIYDPPFLLMVRGNIICGPCIAIVGTRKPTSMGLQAAHDLGFQAASEGYAVVSGLALGVDGQAHEGAIEAGGETMAVFACGIDIVYPSRHIPLAKRILGSGGCFVSETPPGTAPMKHLFPIRNRIISGLSQAVIIVEAPIKSGAMVSAKIALEQGKDVYVHYSGIRNDMKGTKKLAEEGASVIECFQEVMEDMNFG